jgi:hypothetical protein
MASGQTAPAVQPLGSVLPAGMNKQTAQDIFLVSLDTPQWIYIDSLVAKQMLM